MLKKKRFGRIIPIWRSCCHGKKRGQKKKKVPYLKKGQKGQKGQNKGIARRQSALSRPFFRLIQSLNR
jgi:hypothetical protein